MLGHREPEIYGSKTLDDLRVKVLERAQLLGVCVDFRQSNSEGQLIDWVEEARSRSSGIILNAGAYTHTSIALHDALKGAALPLIEVHLSNLFQRESFRHKSYVSMLANGIICGLGAAGYELSVNAMANLLRDVSERNENK